MSQSKCDKAIEKVVQHDLLFTPFSLCAICLLIHFGSVRLLCETIIIHGHSDVCQHFSCFFITHFRLASFVRDDDTARKKTMPKKVKQEYRHTQRNVNHSVESKCSFMRTGPHFFVNHFNLVVRFSFTFSETKCTTNKRKKERKKIGETTK